MRRFFTWDDNLLLSWLEYAPIYQKCTRYKDFRKYMKMVKKRSSGRGLYSQAVQRDDLGVYYGSSAPKIRLIENCRPIRIKANRPKTLRVKAVRVTIIFNKRLLISFCCNNCVLQTLSFVLPLNKMETNFCLWLLYSNFRSVTPRCKYHYVNYIKIALRLSRDCKLLTGEVRFSI